MMLEVSELRKAYGRGEKRVVAADGIGFTADAGSVLGILGPNGSGKTTTVKSCLGLVQRDGGTVRVMGTDPQDGRSEVLRVSGAVLEGARNVYWRLTTLENLNYFAALRGLRWRRVRGRVDELLALLGMEDRATAEVGKLSRGYQQRCAIACALVHDPRVVFLDEPTLGLDVESRHAIERSVRQWAAGGRLVVITSHDMQFIERSCDRALVIRAGRIVAQGTVRGLMRTLVRHTLVLTFHEDAVPEIPPLLRDRGAHVDASGGAPTLTVPLEHPADAETVLASLGEQKNTLASLAVRDNDFETAFLQLLREDTVEEAHP
ncbi:MAG: ABC transporter ATP-binding protein [bacterium]